MFHPRLAPWLVWLTGASSLISVLIIVLTLWLRPELLAPLTAAVFGNSVPVQDEAPAD